MLRYKFRTLLIVLALGPAVLAAPWLMKNAVRGPDAWTKYVLIVAAIDLVAGIATGAIPVPYQQLRPAPAIYGAMLAFAIVSYCIIVMVAIEGYGFGNGIKGAGSLSLFNLLLTVWAAPISLIVQRLRAHAVTDL